MLVVARNAYAQAPDTIRKIDELFAAYNNATPGVAIAISKNYRLIYNKAFGLANLEHAVPNTTETIFECGSVSKQFTAGAILLLAKERKLSLDDDVRKYVPELPRYNAPITIRHLLQHTSGLKDWGVIYEIAGWPRTTRVYTQEMSFDAVFRQQSVNFTPGSQYSYSNSNYVLLVLIVERVTGQSLTTFTNERFFKPLGMRNTRWRDNFRDIIPGRAIAYARIKGSYQQMMPFENVHGPGGLLTTTNDLLRWNLLLETMELFGEDYTRIRIQPGKLNDGTPITYAAGLVNRKINGYTEISHSGATAGYRAWLAWYPELKLSVVLLSNDANSELTGKATALATLFLGPAPEKKAEEPASFIELNQRQVERWKGIYFNAQLNDAFTIDYKEGKLMIGAHPAKAIHPDTLYLDQQFWIWKDRQTILHKNTGTNSFIRVEPAQLDAETIKGYTGTFYSDDADATYRVELKLDNELWIHRKPGDSVKLKAIFKDAFGDDNSWFYQFTRNKQGHITGFEVSLSRAYRVPFRKTVAK